MYSVYYSHGYAGVASVLSIVRIVQLPLEDTYTYMPYTFVQLFWGMPMRQVKITWVVFMITGIKRGVQLRKDLTFTLH